MGGGDEDKTVPYTTRKLIDFDLFIESKSKYLLVDFVV
jgi:hypothetical protein